MRRREGTDLAEGAEFVIKVEKAVCAQTKDREVTLGIKTGIGLTKDGEAIPDIEEAAQHLEGGGEVTDPGLTDTAGDPERVPGVRDTVAGPRALDLEENLIQLS